MHQTRLIPVLEGSMYDNPLFLPAGDQALVVELGDSVSPEINRRIRGLMLEIENTMVPGVIDLVPSYRSLLVYYDPKVIPVKELKARLEGIEESLDEGALGDSHIIHIPTLYGGQYGPDLEFVAEHAGLSTAEVVRIHSGTDYLVYTVGFSPGFPYLGGLSDRLCTPRLDTPRTEIPGGSVGIGDSQTGVYPVASPGGWRLIGRTPLSVFDPNGEPPSLFCAGDYARFVPIGSEEEYLEIEQRVRRGEYPVVREAGP